MNDPFFNVQKAIQADWPYINEKLQKYALDDAAVEWQQFFVIKKSAKTVAFARIIDHGDYFETASLGVDYYHRRKKIGLFMLIFLVEEARRMDVNKPIYAVTHRPEFAEKAGFKEVDSVPTELEYKRQNKCRLNPSKIKILKYIEGERNSARRVNKYDT